MAYNPNIPQANDQLSQSQIDLLANFQAIQTAFQLNHGAFNGATQGKHVVVNFVSQTFPVAGPSGTDVNVFNAVSPDSGVNELWIQKAPLATQIPITETNNLSNNGYSYLSSGILIKWGFTSGNGVVSLGFGASYSTVFGVLLQPSNISQSVYYTTLSIASFTLQGSTSGQPVFWVAIGTAN